MLFLSNAAIRYAVDICQEKEKYKVGIAIRGEDKREVVRELISSMISNSDCVERIRDSKYSFEICFKNGSIIRFIHPSDSSRGQKLHLLIVDRKIPIDIVQNVLKRCEIIEWLEYMYEQDNIKD